MPDVVVNGQVDHYMAAAPWYNAGMSVVPIRADGTKRPTCEWAALQRTRMTPEQVMEAWPAGSPYGVALICGAVSGNLEMTELEAAVTDADSLNKIEAECDRLNIRQVWNQLLLGGYSEWTPSGGVHLIYHIADHPVPGNTKLASRPDATNPKILKTLAETRGEGGYVIVAPTNGRCHPSGDSWDTMAGTQGVVPIISWTDRCKLHEAITAALDETPARPEPDPIASPLPVIRDASDLRPGDDFEIRHDWNEPWFTNQGWRVSHRAAGETFWTRPGKDRKDGHSATTGYKGDKDRLYVWSTSVGLPTEQPLTKFYVYAYYYHNGDLALAAKALRQLDYGTAPSKPGKALVPFTDDPQQKQVALPPHGGLDLTDTGSGRRMKEQFGDLFRFNSREKAWYEWTGTVWRKDERFAIDRAAVAVAEEAVSVAQEVLDLAIDNGINDEIKAARRMLSAAQNLKNQGKLKAAIERFSTEPGIACVPEDFDVNPNLVNLPNGTLDLESNTFVSEHLAEHMLTKTFGAEFDKDAECPQFRQFMADVLPDDDVRAYVQRSLGYTLLGQPTEHSMYLLHGPSGTGKTVLTSLMTSVFGDYGCTAPASTFRLKRQSETLDLHKLRGARFVATSEMPEGQQLDEDLVKRITGGDKVTSRGLYQEFTEWSPRCVVWIATNFLPRVSSDDNAIWRRAKCVRMATEFGPNANREILGYANILVKEASGILNWLLEGLAAYRNVGLSQPDAVTLDIEAYRTDVDTVASFVRDRMDEDLLASEPGMEIRSQSLLAMYETYCMENGLGKLGRRRVANRLKALGYEPVKVGGVAMWRGIGMRSDLGPFHTPTPSNLDSQLSFN
jgi:putative DNA primase/helicase